MSKKDLLISLIATVITSPSNAGMIDKIFDSIPNSIKESLGYNIYTPLGITGNTEIYDASKPHRAYIPNTGIGFYGDGAIHGQVHGSSITPGSFYQEEEPLDPVVPYPLAPYYDMRQLNHKSLGAQLSKDEGTNPVAANNLMRAESDIENLHKKLGRMAKKSRNNRQQQIKKKFKRQSKQSKQRNKMSRGRGKSDKKKSKKPKK